MSNDAARVAANRLAQIGVVVRCGVRGAGHCSWTTYWIADQIVIVHFLDIICNINIVLVLSSGPAGLLLLDVGRHAAEFHVDILGQVVRWRYRSLILATFRQGQRSILTNELVHVCSLNNLLAPLPVDGLLVVLVLPVVNLAHKATII